MARKNRINELGYYHVINRGVERRNIFLEPEDYDKFLDLLLEVKKKYNTLIHTYCLMTNHYHILLETKQTNISDALKYLNSNYSIYFNKKYKRSGHLWQGRFSSYFLYDDMHFWIVAKYIERNPITANMVKQLDQYKHQSYFQWKYQLEYFKLLEDSIIFDMTLKEYEEYISTEMQEDVYDKIYATPKLVKQDGEFKILYKRLETFFQEDTDINRNENINKAYQYGYTKQEITDYLGLNYSTVTRCIKKQDSPSS